MTDVVVRSRKVARSLDGMISASPEGRKYRVCEPAWWQIHRWISRWLAKDKGAIGVTRDGQVFKVYVVRYEPKTRR